MRKRFPGLGRFGGPAPLLLAFLPLCAGGCDPQIQEPGPGGPQAGGVRLVWRTPLTPGPAGPFTRPTTDGKYLYAEAERRLQAFDLRTGRPVWSQPFETRTAPDNVVVRGGRVFAVGEVAVARDATSGRELWRYTLDANASFSASAADDRAFYFGTERHRVYALRVADGSVLWSTDLAPGWEFKGIVRGASVSGDTVYFGMDRYHSPNGNVSSGWIFALDRATGRVLWSYQNGTGSDNRNIYAAPQVAGPLLLAIDHPYNTYIAVDRFTGKEAWRVAGPFGFAGPQESPVLAGGVAYGSSADRFVTAMDAQTGRVLWRTQTPASNRGLAVCGGRVLANYLGVAVLDRTTGALLGRMYEDEEFPTSDFAVAGDRAFVLGNDAVYAFQCS